MNEVNLIVKPREILNDGIEGFEKVREAISRDIEENCEEKGRKITESEHSMSETNENNPGEKER